LSGLLGQILDFREDRVLAATQKQGNTTAGSPRDCHFEDPLVQIWPVLMLDGLDPRGAELPATRLALIPRDGLVVVLGATVALLAVEVGRRRRVVNASRVGAGGPGVPHGPKLT